jgi:hypothetical protein
MAALSAAMQDATDPNKAELTCKIEIADDVSIVDGRIPVTLVITNVSDYNIMLSTMCGGGSGRWTGNFEINMKPDFWVSDQPRPDQIQAKIILMQPHDSFRMPMDVPWDLEWLDDDGSLTVGASYSVGKKYGELYRVWHGYIKAEPVKISNPKKQKQ